MDYKYISLCPTSPIKPGFYIQIPHFHWIAALQFNFLFPNQKPRPTDTLPTKAILILIFFMSVNDISIHPFYLKPR